jgi:hypothetical protein
MFIRVEYIQIYGKIYTTFSGVHSVPVPTQDAAQTFTFAHFFFRIPMAAK